MSGSSIGNQSPYYQLRLDRVRRIYDGYRAGRITPHEFRKLMEQEGFVLKFVDALREIVTFEPLADINARLVRRLHS